MCKSGLRCLSLATALQSLCWFTTISQEPNLKAVLCVSEAAHRDVQWHHRGKSVRSGGSFDMVVDMQSTSDIYQKVHKPHMCKMQLS